MRTLAIGDIHGCRRALEELTDYVGFAADDTIIAVGDYVDRGPDSKGVLNFLLGLQRTHRLIHLRGNHEIMMLRARSDRAALLGWCRVGGEETLQSYGAASLDDLPPAHWEFLETSVPFFENETHFFVHANALPGVPLRDQPEFMLYWEFFDSPARHMSGKTMICGHSAQKSGIPLSVGHAICIDTFVYGGGWLTCLDTVSGRYWQTNEAGERRCDVITGREN